MWRKVAAFPKQETFHLGITNEHKLASAKRAIPGDGNTGREDSVTAPCTGW